MLIKDYPVIYNQKANGLVQVHKMHVWQNEDGSCTIHSEYGQLNGIMTKSVKNIFSGKNIGRSNETSIAQQAIMDADSIFQKKIDKKYTENLDDVGKNIGLNKIIPDPMLAKDYAEHHTKIIFPAYVQPKLDGIRCIARKENGEVQLYTRGGKLIPFMSHIKYELSQILNDDEIFDGELYTPEITFQQIVSIVRKTKEEDENSHLIQYHIYDYPIENIPFSERYKLLCEKVVSSNALVLVETQQVTDEDDIFAFHIQMKRIGYEGTMVRNAAGLYRFKYRSSDLLKYKDFIDEEYLIIGMREDTGPDGDECVFECQCENGTFMVRPTGSSDYKKSLISNKHLIINKKYLTVKFQEKTDGGIPRFPVGVEIRDYE